jgi:hypothetical protein
MKSLCNRMLAIVALGIATICANASPAAAQALKGSFTLPDEVRWQGSTLPAGDYTFSIKSVGGPAMIQLHGPKGGSYVMAITASTAEVGDRSVLILEHRAGMSFVRDLYLAQIGVRLHYYVPKPKQDERLAQGPVTTEQVLVASAK